MFFQNFVKNLFDARGLCVRAHAKIMRALRLHAVTIAMNCIPRDDLAHPTRGSQLVINSSSWSLSKV